MATVAELLADAEKFLGTPRAVEALVALWQDMPDPAIADLIDRHDAAWPQPLFEGEFAKAPVAARARLLQTLVGQKMAATLVRLNGMLTWDRDPRTSRAIERLLRDVPYTSDGSRVVWQLVFRLVRSQKDPRFAAIAPELEAGWKFRDGHRTWMSRALAAAVKDLPRAAAVLTGPDAKRLAAMSAALKPPRQAPTERDEAELLADVYARPDDDGPRLVYADWLQERGDPRGEFIALQCAATRDPKREAALLKAHGDAWLGPLGPAVLKGTEFRRGFPARVTVRFRHQKDVEAHAGTPAWGTIEEAAWSPASVSESERQWTSFIPPAMNPRVLHLWEAGTVHLLAAKRPWARLEELRVVVGDVDLQKRFAASALFPKVRKLTLMAYGSPALVQSGWATQLTELVLERHQPDGFAGWLAAVGRSQLASLTFDRPKVATLTFTRGDDGMLSKGHFALHHATGLRDLQLIPDGWFTALTTGGKVAVDAALVAQKTRKQGKPAPALPVPEADNRDADGALLLPLAIGWHADGPRGVDLKRMVAVDGEGRFTRAVALNHVMAAAFSPDARLLVTGSWKKADLRDADTGDRIRELALPSKTRQFAFDASGTRLLALCDGHAQVWAVPAGDELRKFGFGSFPRRPICAAISDDGETIAVGMYDKTAAVYPPGVKRPALKLEHPDFVQQVLFVGPGRLATICRDEKARVFDAVTGKLLVERTLGADVQLSLVPGGTQLLAAGPNRTRVIDAQTLADVETLGDAFERPAISSDGKKIAGRVKGRLVVKSR